MSEKIKKLWETVKERLKRVSKKAYIITAVVVVVLAAALTFALNNKPYSVLFTGVSPSEASSILSFLEGQGITDYKVENNDTILVPKGKEDALKARLVMEGYPQSGYAYSTYYDHVGSLSTESERNNAYLLFLQESISNVIRNFDNVKDAKVFITRGEDRGYVLDSGNVVDATAAVQVTMNGAAKLSNQQAEAIRNLVSHAVQGLEIGSVIITDTMGNTFTAVDEYSNSDSSALKLRLEEAYQNKIRTDVLQALTPFFGEDNVRVSVNCQVEVSQRTVNSRDVQLPEWAQDGSTGGKGIIGSRIYEYYVGRPGNETAGGVVGTTTNSDLPEYVERGADTDGTELEVSGSGQTDYDNPWTETSVIYTAGYLKDCTVAVSVNADAAGGMDADTIRTHVARAAGIAGTVDPVTGEEYLADKISVVTNKFYSPEVILPNTGIPVPVWMLYAAAGGLLLFLILLIVILRIRKKRKKKAAKDRELDELLASAGFPQAAAPTAGADVMALQTEKSMELRKEVRQFASDNPELAAQLIRGWMRGGDDNE